MRLRTEAVGVRTGYVRAVRRSELVLAVGLVALGCVEVLAVPLADDVVRGPLALNLAAVVAYGAPIAVMSRAPVLAFCVVHAALGLRALVSDPLELYVPLLAGVVVAWALGSSARLRDSAVGAAVAAAGLGVAQARGTGGDATPDAVATMVILAMVWGIARVAGQRLTVSRTALERSQELDQLRAISEAEAVAAERRRIARELHDAVSHSLSMITMQAGGAQDVVERDPALARRSLRAIEDAARAGLGEMRELLGLLDGAPTNEPAGLGRVSELLDRARRAGLDVTWSTAGRPRPLPAEVDAVAYRVVQEALTNAARHGGRCTAHVTVEHLRGEVRLTVVNDLGPDRGAGGSGRGLAGMRHRVEGLGGELTTSAYDGGFGVVASLPISGGQT